VSDSPERALAVSLIVDLARREARAARALLAAEMRTLRGLRGAARPVIDRAQLAVSGARDAREAMVAVRRSAPILRESVERALLDARSSTRRAARRDAVRHPRQGTSHEEDAAAAHAAASSYAAAWAATAMAQILAHAEKGSRRSLAPALSGAPVDYRLRRIAATETARAYNDERVSRMRAEHSAKAGAFQVWSAILDRRTCATCFERDGRTIELHARFDGSPPLHVCCRCVIEFVQVPHPERLEDIGIDYDLFKREMRDVIRERRTTSERHASRFVASSMGAKRSPVALTRKFASLRP
jgi:SPP1 gp7 family putative phage head morphogenesis protein